MSKEEEEKINLNSLTIKELLVKTYFQSKETKEDVIKLDSTVRELGKEMEIRKEREAERLKLVETVGKLTKDVAILTNDLNNRKDKEKNNQRNFNKTIAIIALFCTLLGGLIQKLLEAIFL